jgi:hypothetical protein
MTGFCTASPPFAAALADLAISPVLAATQVNAALIEKGSPVWDRVKAIVTPYIPAVENFELKQPPKLGHGCATAPRIHRTGTAAPQISRCSAGRAG